MSCNILHLVPGDGKISTMHSILCALFMWKLYAYKNKMFTEDDLMVQHEENLAMINRLVGT